MEEIKIEPLKAYRGSAKFFDWCKENGIEIGSYTCLDKNVIYIVKDNKIFGYISNNQLRATRGKLDQYLLDSGVIVECELPKWRAKKGGDYYFIDSTLMVIPSEEQEDFFDDRLYSIGNYFRTKKEAEEKLKLVKEKLKEL